MPDKRTSPENTELEASTRRWMVAGLILMALFVLAFPVYRLYEPARRADAREEQQRFLAAQGAELFEANCSSCHGPEGSGGFGPAVGSKEFLDSVDDEQLSQRIALGVPGTAMVAYSLDYGGPLTAEQIEAITTYLRSLQEPGETAAGP